MISSHGLPAFCIHACRTMCRRLILIPLLAAAFLLLAPPSRAAADECVPGPCKNFCSKGRSDSTFTDNSGNACRCGEGAFTDSPIEQDLGNGNTMCLACPTGGTWNPDTKSCACPAHSHPTGAIGCACDAGYVSVGSSGCFPCPSDASYNAWGGGTCVCHKPGTAFDWRSRACVCAGGKQLNAQTGRCECPATMEADEHGFCVCPGDTVYNKNTNACHCPPDYP